MTTRQYVNGHVAVKSCRHGAFIYNINDTFIGTSLDLYGEWCEDELQTLKQVLGRGKVVLDVGANIGTHTVFFAKQVTPDGVVFAFEPQRLVFQQLCANVALNGLLNVIARPQALADKKGHTRLTAFDPRQAMNFGAVALGSGDEGELVEVVTIDDLQLARCDLIKIDVEGFETQVLAGGRETIKRCLPILFVENDTVERSNQVVEAIYSLDYVAYWQIANYFNPDNFFGNNQNVFAHYQPQANLLCFPRALAVNIDGYEPVHGTDDDWRKAVQRMRKE